MIRWTTDFSFSPITAIVYAMSPGRLGASLGMVLGLIGVVAGAMAVARSGRRGALVALALGPIGSGGGADTDHGRERIPGAFRSVGRP